MPKVKARAADHVAVSAIKGGFQVGPCPPLVKLERNVRDRSARRCRIPILRRQKLPEREPFRFRLSVSQYIYPCRSITTIPTSRRYNYRLHSRSLAKRSAAMNT